MTAPAHIVSHAAALPPVMLFPAVLGGAMLLAYLLGSIPFGLLLGKCFKVGDLRTIGSGNIGATNMLRAGGRNLAIATLALDMAKGIVAVLLCTALMNWALQGRVAANQEIALDLHAYSYIFGLYAVAGHVWPVWLKGKGGKGVATALGVLLAFSLPLGLLVIACWLAVFALTKYSSLSALVSVALAPLLAWVILGKSAIIATLLIALIVIYRHKANISRLLNGSEPQSNLSKKA